MAKHRKRRARTTSPANPPNPVTPPVTDHSKEIILDAGLGIVLVLLIACFKIAVEGTQVGESIDVDTYAMIQNFVRPAEIKVAVLDISDLQREPLPGSSRAVTPRQRLRDLLREVANHGPFAIGLDLNFAPFGADKFVTTDDLKLFDDCLLYSSEKGIPVFVGLNWGQRWEDTRRPETLLENSQYKPLMAWILAPRDRMTRHMPLNYEDGSVRMPSLSAALAAVNAQSLELPWLWSHFVKRTSVHRLRRGTAHMFAVDYSPLRRIQSPEYTYTMHTVEPSVVRNQGDVFKDKIVLIGDGTHGDSQDKFPVVAGENGASQGVYIHACAANTLVMGPLYELEPAGRVAVDLLLETIGLGCVIAIRWRYRAERSRKVDTHKLQRLFMTGAALMVGIAAIVFIRYARLLWTDCVLVIGALMLHPTVERVIVVPLRFLKNNARSIKDKAMRFCERVIFERGGKAQ
jgi:CHASE2 domain-containing sensor protein